MVETLDPTKTQEQVSRLDRERRERSTNGLKVGKISCQEITDELGRTKGDSENGSSSPFSSYNQSGPLLFGLDNMFGNIVSVLAFLTSVGIISQMSLVVAKVYVSLYFNGFWSHISPIVSFVCWDNSQSFTARIFAKK